MQPIKTVALRRRLEGRPPNRECRMCKGTGIWEAKEAGLCGTSLRFRCNSEGCLAPPLNTGDLKHKELIAILDENDWLRANLFEAHKELRKLRQESRRAND